MPANETLKRKRGRRAIIMTMRKAKSVSSEILATTIIIAITFALVLFHHQVLKVLQIITTITTVDYKTHSV